MPNARGWLWLEAVGGWLAEEGQRQRLNDQAEHAIPDEDEPETAYEVDKTRNVYLEGLAEEAIQARQQAERETREAVERAADTETRLREAPAERRRLKGMP